MGIAESPARVSGTRFKIATFTGRLFSLECPQEDEVDILDVAQSLSHTSRYLGHSKRFYSTAEHSVWVSYMVPPQFAFQGLMHDAPEAYTGDLTRPMKLLIGLRSGYFRVDRRITRVVHAHFGLPERLAKAVHEADAAICLAERVKFHPRSPAWSITADYPRQVRLVGLPPEEARELFLDRYAELTGEDARALKQAARDIAATVGEEDRAYEREFLRAA